MGVVLRRLGVLLLLIGMAAPARADLITGNFTLSVDFSGASDRIYGTVVLSGQATFDSVADVATNYVVTSFKLDNVETTGWTHIVENLSGNARTRSRIFQGPNGTEEIFFRFLDYAATPIALSGVAIHSNNSLDGGNISASFTGSFTPTSIVTTQPPTEQPTTVPEPAAFGLLLLSLAGLAAARRRDPAAAPSTRGFSALPGLSRG